MRSSAEYGDAFTSTPQPEPGLDRRALGAGLLGAGLGLFAAPAFSQTIPPPSVPPVPVPSEDEETQLLSNLFTRMAVKTEINGRSGFAFVMDTGAGRTAIAHDIAEALRLPPGPPILVHGLTSAELTPTARITRLSFGGRRFTDVYAGVYPRNLLGADGLMGLDVLSRFALEFDLVKRTLNVIPSGGDRVEFAGTVYSMSHIPQGSRSRTRIGRFGQLILINARVDGVQADCFIDSGAQHSIGNLALFRAVAPGMLRPSERALVPVYGVTGQTILAERAGVSQVALGSRRLGPTPLLFADLHAFETLDLIERPALLLGGDILQRFQRVALDFGRQRMDFGAVRRASSSQPRL